MEVPPAVVVTEPASDDSLVAQLHRAALDNRPGRIRRCLARGCHVDAPNAAGQTALFCAALSARAAAAGELLRRGADPNARCDGGATAVHAACYAGRRRLLRRLLESGGDLRLHDLRGRRPADWARLQPDPARRRRVLQLIETARLAALSASGRDALEMSTSVSAGGGGGGVRTLLRRLLPADSPRRAAAARYDRLDLAELARSVQSVGFGAVYYGGGAARPGAVALLPLAAEAALEPDRSARSYRLAVYTEMAPRLFRGAPVSVRRLAARPPPDALPDLLISELESARRLHHPGLLQLLAVCPLDNLDGLGLVFERVPLGSLHHCLYRRGLRVPPRAAAALMAQVCAALQFLHNSQWLHCAVTSHAVQLLSTSHAKLACLEHAVDASGGQPRPQSRLLACRADGALYNWLAPEVLREGVPSRAADTYSVCAVTWELLHGRPPWDGLTAQEITAQAAAGGRQLPLPAEATPPLLRHLLLQGLRPDPRRRDLLIDEASFMLSSFCDGVRRTDSRPITPTSRPITPTSRPITPTSRPITPTSRPATPTSRPVTPTSRPLTPTIRAATPTGRPATLDRRRVKRPAPLPPPRLSRTLSPEPPEERRPSRLLSRTLSPEPPEERRPSRLLSRTLSPERPRDPYTGLRRTPGERRLRSATWQPAGPAESAAETAIKPASHRLTRHGSTCSLTRRPAAGGAAPWPAPERRRQAPRPPRFSPSPAAETGLTQLMADLDLYDLFPPLAAPPDAQVAAQNAPQTGSIPPLVRSSETPARPSSAARRQLAEVLVQSFAAVTEVAGEAANGAGSHSNGPTVAANGSAKYQRNSTGSAEQRSSSTGPAGGQRSSSTGPAGQRISSSSTGPSDQRSNGTDQRSNSIGPADQRSNGSGPGNQRSSTTESANQRSSSTGPTDQRSSSAGPTDQRSNGTGQGDQRSSNTQGSESVEPKWSGGGSTSPAPAEKQSSGDTRTDRIGSSSSSGGIVGKLDKAAAAGRQQSSSSGPQPATSSSWPGLAGTSSSGPGQTCTSSSGPGQTGTSTSGPGQTGTSSSGPGQTGTFSSGNIQTGTSSSGNIQTGTSSSGNIQTGTSNSGNIQTGTSSSGPGQTATPSSSGPGQTATPSSEEPSPASYSRQTFAARRQFFSGGAAGPPESRPLRLPRALTLNPALLARREPAAGRSWPDQPRPFQRPASVRGPPRTPAAALTSTPQPAAAASPPRLNVTFHSAVLELGSGGGSPASDRDSDRFYYDDDLASPHLQLLDAAGAPEEAADGPPAGAAWLDDGGRASPLSMELPSSGADSDDSDWSAPLTPLRVSEGGSPPDGSRVRFIELACRPGFETSVRTAAAEGRCTVTCTSRHLADGTTRTYRQTIDADEVHTQIAVADR